MAFLAILEFNKQERQQKKRSRGSENMMKNKVGNDYIEGNTGALGGLNGNDSQTDVMSDPRRNRFKVQTVNNPDQYTSEEVDLTPGYGNTQMNSSMQRL